MIGSLEVIYQEAYESAKTAGDEGAMRELDFGFQRDQVVLEVLLDLRDSLVAAEAGDQEEEKSSLLDKAKAVRRFTKLGRP